MTPAEASAILDREHAKFEAQYQPPEPPAIGTWTSFALAAMKLRAWEEWAVAALEAVGEPIEEAPRPTKPERDTSGWYARQIAATERRIERNKRAITKYESLPEHPKFDHGMMQVPLKVRQRGMVGEMKTYRAYEDAKADMPAATFRLRWLEERASR